MTKCRMIVSRIGLALVLSVVAGRSQAGTFDAWPYRMTATFSGYDKPETLTNFPVLVVLSNNVGNSGFDYDNFSSATGADLRFATSNETDELNYEIEKWDTNGASYVWVQVPNLGGPGDYIYAYWGHASATQPDYTSDGSTWSNGYRAVWHLSADEKDSTSNANHGVNYNSTNAVGIIGHAQGFDGANDYVDFGSSPSLDLGANRTITAWVKLSELKQYACVVSKNAGPRTNPYSWIMSTHDNGTLQAYDNTAWRASGNAAIGLDTWHHLVYETRSDGKIYFYVNGQSAGSSTFNYADTAAHVVYIGSRYAVNTTRDFNGLIDEVTISEGARGSNWAWACWSNQTANSAFITYSDAGPVSTDLAVKSLPPTGIGPASATLRGQVLQTGEAENPEVFVCWAYADAGTNSGTSVWANVGYLGTDWGQGESFSTQVTGLLSGSNYTYRCYVTNSTGEDWSEEAQSFTTISLPAATNLGAANVAAGTAELRGAVTDTGHDAPAVWFEYWLSGGASTSTVSAGVQTGLFATVITGLDPASGYAYRVAAANAAGTVYSEPASFNTSNGLYVALGGDDSTGAGWTTAFTNLQTAVEAAGDGAVIFVRADAFSRTNQIDLSGKVNLHIRGGYEGTGPEPGPLAAEPSRIVRASGLTRLFYGNAATVTLERVWIQGGYLTAENAKGAGLFFTGGSAVSLLSCTLSNNYTLAAGYTCQGGGLYISGGSLYASNTTFRENSVRKASWNTGSYGGALYAGGAQVSLVDCQFVQNHVWSRHQPNHGGAVYLAGAEATLAGCVFSNNYTRSEGNSDAGPTQGGAVHANGVTSLLIENSLFTANRLWITSGNTRQGGALYLGGAAGHAVVRRCVFVNNGDGAEEQGDIAITAGTLAMTNILVARSAGGSGLFSNGGTVQVTHGTFASNVLHGVNRMAGTLRVRHSIAWGNGTSGFYNTDDVEFSCSQDVVPGTGNLTDDPLFVDGVYFHIQARAGAYSGGYFSGGTWAPSGADSPALDAADAAADYDQEPHPNGFQANMGAYGNSPTASKTYLQDPGVFTDLTAFAHPVVSLSPTSVRLRGQVLSAGGAEDPHAYLCWGTADGGAASTGAWQHVRDMGNRAEWELFTHDLTDLEGDWFYRAYITNSTGSDWSAAVAFGAPNPATVTNLGPYRVLRTTAHLRGQVLADDGNTPDLWFWHWPDGGAVTSITAVGSYAAPLTFSVVESNLMPDTVYHYRVLSSNAIGLSWSDTATYTTLATNPIGRYVTVDGAGNNDGTSWSNAFIGIADAMAACTYPGDAIYVKNGTYVHSVPVDLSGKDGLTISGGYAGDGAPGDLSDSPTIFTRNTDFLIRLVQGVAATATLERIRMQGGYLSAGSSQGAGLHLSGGSRVNLISCTLSNNVISAANDCQGGSVYLNASSLYASNCTFAASSVRKVDYSTGSYGGAIYARNSALLLVNCTLAANYVWTRHRNCYGGALYLTGGSLDIRDSAFTGNYTTQEGNTDGPGPARGGAIHADAPAAFSLSGTFFQGNRCYTPNSAASVREGGAVYVTGGTGTGVMTRCVLTGNGDGADEKGDIFLGSGAMEITHVLVAGSAGGNGVHNAAGTLDLVHCTLISNVLNGVSNETGVATIRNTIAWGNAAGGIATNAVVTFTCAQEPHDGEGNFVADPLFVDTTYGHLQSRAGHYAGGYFSGGSWDRSLLTSPCIDAGDPSSPYGLEPAPSGRRVNLGAYGNTEVASKSASPGSVIMIR